MIVDIIAIPDKSMRTGREGKDSIVDGWMVGLVVIKFNKSALAIPFIFHVRDRNIRPQRVSLPLYYPIGYILIKQHLTYLLEKIFDILSSLRADLQKRYIIFIRQSLSLSQLHHSLCFEI